MDTPLENSHRFWNLKITWFEKETLLNHPPPVLGFNMLIVQDVSRQIMSFAQLLSAKNMFLTYLSWPTIETLRVGIPFETKQPTGL